MEGKGKVDGRRGKWETGEWDGSPAAVWCMVYSVQCFWSGQVGV